MKDTKNILIAMLCVSALMLGTILVLINTSAPVYASTPVRGGNYIMVNGTIANAQDLVYIINLASGQLNVYGIDGVQRTVTLADSINLKAEFRK